MSDQTAAQPLLLRVDVVAQMLTLGKTKVYDLIAAGELRAVRLGPRCTRIDPADLQDFIQKRREQQ